jgi:hypothetical protein
MGVLAAGMLDAIGVFEAVSFAVMSGYLLCGRSDYRGLPRVSH